MKFPTIKEMAEEVAEKALDEVEYNGKTIREWVEIISAIPVTAIPATDINVATKDCTNLAEVGTDCISRQAAISAICNACGKIDCDKMDKCEKLQLPPANCSEFPNNSDTISRQAAIDAARDWYEGLICGSFKGLEKRLRALPSAEPKRGKWIPVTNGRGGHECDQCHEYAPSYQSGEEHLSDICPHCGAKMEVNHESN